MSDNYKNRNILGEWKAKIGDTDIFLKFVRNGDFYCMKKKKDKPVELYIGGYTFGVQDDKLISVIAQRFGYAEMPFEETVYWDMGNDELFVTDYDNGNFTFTNTSDEEVRFSR